MRKCLLIVLMAAATPLSSRAGEEPAAPGKAIEVAARQRPSFACDGVEAGSIEAMICADAELSAFDVKLSEVYQAASQKAFNEHPTMLKAQQRGWIKGRDECWKAADRRACVRSEYQRRIAELQARYRLLDGTGPVRYVCDGNPANEVVAMFFGTDPPTLMAERGDRSALMFLQPSASGTRYQGRNETLWEHQGEAVVTWEYDGAELHCKRMP